MGRIRISDAWPRDDLTGRSTEFGGTASALPGRPRRVRFLWNTRIGIRAAIPRRLRNGQTGLRGAAPSTPRGRRRGRAGLRAPQAGSLDASDDPPPSGTGSPLPRSRFPRRADGLGGTNITTEFNNLAVLEFEHGAFT